MNETGRTLTILYTNGTEQIFALPPQGPETTMAGRIQDMTNSNVLVLELEDRTLIIPQQNIQSLELSPSPPKLPSMALRGLRRLK